MRTSANLSSLISARGLRRQCSVSGAAAPAFGALVRFDVLLYTGLRRGDAVRLGRPHVKNGVATIRTHKTGQVVSIPILPPLQATLDAGPIGDLIHCGRTRPTDDKRVIWNVVPGSL